MRRVAEADPRRIGGSAVAAVVAARRRARARLPAKRRARRCGGERPRCRRERQPARVRRGGRAVARGHPADQLVRSDRLVRAAGGVAAAALAWGLFEAQWVQCRRLSIGVPGLPPELAGLRILHLSDPHLGSVSLERPRARAGRLLRSTLQAGPGRRHRRSPGAAARRGDVAPRAPRREGGPRLLRRARQRRPRRHAGSVQHRWRGRARSARQAARGRVGSGRHQRTDGPDRRTEPGEPLRSRRRPRRSRERPANPARPLPGGRRPAPAGIVRARSLGAYPRRPDLPSLSRRQAALRRLHAAVPRRSLRASRDDARRLAGDRDDVRPVSLSSRGRRRACSSSNRHRFQAGPRRSPAPRVRLWPTVSSR